MPLEQARRDLSDRHRIGLVLQFAALLAHLRRAGHQMEPGAWRSAAVGRDLQLCGLAAAGDELDQFVATQQELRALLLWLFGVDERIAGRGQARRVARTLVDSWQQSLTDLGPRRCVRQILRRSPFLWQRGFEVHRLALLATRDGGRVWQIVGPRSWRRNLVAEAKDPDTARTLIGSSRARSMWSAPWNLAQLDGAQLFERGHWRAAVLRWRDAPPSTDGERLLEARAHYALGKFDTVLERLRGRQDIWSCMYRVASHHHLGDLHRAMRGLLVLEDRIDREGARERLALAEVALRVLRRRHDERRIADWVARCLASAKGRWRGEGHLHAAIGEFDRGRLERCENHLEIARRAGVDEGASWQLLQTEALVMRQRGRLEEATARLDVALRFHRRSLRVFEAGRLWNDLAITRYASGQRDSAERAITHAHRLLERCDGPLARDLTLSNLAEMRIRGGRLDGVEELLESSREHSRAQGNRSAQAHDDMLSARWFCAQGRWEEALAALASAEGAEAPGVQLGEIRALRCLVHTLRGQGALATRAAETLDQLAPDWLEPEEAPLIAWLRADTLGFEASCASSPAGECWLALRDLGQGEVSAEPFRERLWDLWQSARPERGARWILLAHRLSPGGPSPSQLDQAARHFESRGLPRLADPLRSAGLGLSGSAAKTAVLWPALERLLEQAPQNEAELRRWFEALPIEDLSVERRGDDGRRLVLLQRRGDSEVRRLGAWRWRVDPALDAAVGAVVQVVDRCCPWLDNVAGTMPSAPPEQELPEGWVGSSRVLIEAADQLARLGRSQLPVLVLGETGTGKELAARRVHDESNRCRGPFLPLNCAAVSEQVLLSELFGHVRGAFTGADRDHKGLFESAQGGTVFLDEIGDLPSAAQGMLLRVLQEGEIRRIGDNHSRSVDARVVAATHRDLPAMVEAGTFRQDLLYRLNVGQVALPPLRERPEDVVPLAEHFLRQIDPGCRLADDTKAVLAAHSWPGNVRELKGVIERAAVLRRSVDQPLGPEELGVNVRPEAVRPPLHEWLEQLKRQRVLDTLRQCEGNQARAARQLGITRQAMSYLVRQMKK